jgi:hypothetical protein
MNAKIFRLLITMIAMAISSESAFSKSGYTCAACEKAIFSQVDICLNSSARPTDCVNLAMTKFRNCNQNAGGECRNTQGQNLHDALVTIQGTNAWNPDGISVALAGAINSPVVQAPVSSGGGGGGGAGAAVGGVLLLGGAAAAAGLAAIAAGGLGGGGGSSGGGCGAGQAPCGNYGVCCGDLQYYCPSNNSCGSALRSCSSAMTACHN